MFAMWWPVALIVFSNIVYNLCAKSSPEALNPLAGLTVTYAVAAIASGVLYTLLNRGGNLLSEYRAMNWTTVAFGLAIVGLEAGCLYLYRAGWDVSAGHLTHSAILAVCLLIIGAVFFREHVSFSRIFGSALVLIGLVFINR